MDTTKIITKAKEVITSATKETKSIIIDYAVKIFEKEITKVQEEKAYEAESEKVVLLADGTLNRYKTDKELKELLGEHSKVIPIGISALTWQVSNKGNHLENSIKQRTDAFTDVEEVYIQIDNEFSPCAKNEIFHKHYFDSLKE